LTVHCYRILGSLEDAEDALQETYLRAWRRLDSLRMYSALRAWLYKIATHVSLDMLDSRKARSMPTALYEPAESQDPLPDAIGDPIWLEPLPDTYLDGSFSSPESQYEAHESVTLAFLTALQKLPGRQRAVLILRDVLGFPAQEVADLLDQSVVSVNSALQRARTTLKSYPSEYRVTTNDQQTTALLAQYVQAWEAADSARLVALLREDAILTMPPLPTWFRGRTAIQRFLDTHLFNSAFHIRLIPTRANGCPAFAVYQQMDGLFRPAALQILTVADGQIARIDDFLTSDSRLFARFDLPVLG
jgi:RNA polymerase sigma-70 factor (ECF subfamily)